MWKINWKLVSALVVIGGLVSVFVYSNTKSAIIFVIAFIITALMEEMARTQTEERRKDILEELSKEIKRETGRKLSDERVLGESALVINEITRTREK